MHKLISANGDCKDVDRNLKTKTIILILLILPMVLSAQIDSLKSKLNFEGDFRFRVEQDWNSKKSDGTFRDNRTRFRYRLRAGILYKDKWYSTGFRIRTGNPIKQQDPQLTLGDGFKEYGTLPVGLEKVYFQGEWNTFKFWVGKNTFPFEKSNELFWSDNVYPEGITFEKGFRFSSTVIDLLEIKGGHYIISSSGKSLSQDTYFQGYQINAKFLENRFELFPAFYLFKNVPNIPDGNETFEIDYAIFHLGNRLKIMRTPLLIMEFDFYKNLQSYSQNDSIPTNFKQQKSGVVIGLKYGSLKQKGDWLFKASYANLQQYSAVDFMAQNDWARWDYSSFGSPDGRLTNFNGIELVAGFMVDKKVSLKMKYYVVKQLIAYGRTKETGNRIRLDLDVKF